MKRFSLVRFAEASVGWRTCASRFLTSYSAGLACLFLALAGMRLLDDYGASIDESLQRNIALVSADYALGRSNELLSHRDRSHGVAFELFLLAIERLLRLEDSRHILLSRHLASHLVFALGGWCCAQLALRLTGDRRLAFCALCLFVLHPRLYAHSFFNSKDVPFLSLFMLALLLLHRAFRAETARAFLLAGAGVGLLTNIRLAGALLLGAVLIVRACDLVCAPTPAARRRILWTTGLFAATAALTLYATWPYLWGDPIERLGLSFRRLARWRLNPVNLFQGQFISAQNVPAHYVPAWFAITTPPNALLLGGLGVVALVRRSLVRPGSVLRNTRLRFQCLLLACCVLPALLAIALDFTLYHGWRHMYFLYAPFCLLAIGGLHALTTAARGLRRVAGGAYGLAAAMLGATALVHPYQHLYFNFLVDRVTPERLRTQYDMDYWQIAYRDALAFLLARHPAVALSTRSPHGDAARNFLPAADRQRLALVSHEQADFYLFDFSPLPSPPPPYAPVVYTRTAYRSTVVSVAAVNLDRVDAAQGVPYRAAYRSAIARAPAVRARFDIYLDDRAVYWIREACLPEDTAPKFILHVTPVDPRALPGRSFENLDFYFHQRGVRFNDKCLAAAPLPAYPLRHMRIGQWLAEDDRMLWRVDLPVPLAPDAVNAYRAAYRALAAEPPTHRGVFDVYVTADRVAVAKAPCTAADAAPKFILHVTPVDPRVLPGRSFENLDFHFYQRGVRFNGQCLAAAPLPAYPLRHMRIGQWLAEDDRMLWRVDLPVPWAPDAVNAYRAAYRALAAEPPTHRGVFNVYVTADRVAMVKDPCTAADTQPRFILHVVPARTRDLPPDRRSAGFVNLDFQFDWQGAHFDGRCLAQAPLPDYPVTRLRVGQFRGRETALWLAELPVRS